MASSIPAGRLRREMGRDDWRAPEVWGPDGWRMFHKSGRASVIVSVGRFEGVEFVHASIARSDRMPDYLDLTTLHRAAFGDGWAFQVFAPPSEHVNIHERALHLWGRLDGYPIHPNFAPHGTI